MDKIPLLSAKKVFKILKKLGFEQVRQQGSHVFFRHADGRTTIIPNHPGETLDRGLLNKIIKKDLQLSREDFLRRQIAQGK